MKKLARVVMYFVGICLFIDLVPSAFSYLPNWVYTSISADPNNSSFFYDSPFFTIISFFVPLSFLIAASIGLFFTCKIIVKHISDKKYLNKALLFTFLAVLLIGGLCLLINSMISTYSVCVDSSLCSNTPYFYTAILSTLGYGLLMVTPLYLVTTYFLGKMYFYHKK